MVASSVVTPLGRAVVALVLVWAWWGRPPMADCGVRGQLGDGVLLSRMGWTGVKIAISGA
jgi:hypothetical protein